MPILDSINKRKNKGDGKYYQDALGTNLYLRYKRPEGAKTGTWIARSYNPKTGKVTQGRIGDADDFLAADGVKVLTFAQAKTLAEAWAAPKPVAAPTATSIKGVTVRDVITAYVEEAKATRKDPRTAEDSRQAAEANIIPALGDVLVADLTVEGLKSWRNGLIKHGRILTGRTRRPGDVIKFAPLPDQEDDEEAYRVAVKRRKSSANRILALLKAALNLAVTDESIPEGAKPWSKVLPFKAASSQRMRFLDVGEMQALVAACDPELKLLVSAALFTGARYGELIKAKVQDLNLEVGTLWVDGKGQDTRERHISLTEEGAAFFKELAMGKAKDDLLFTRRSVVRRSGAGATAVFGDTRISLSPNEAAVLALLAERAGKGVPYAKIEEMLWPGVDVGMRTVNTLDQLRRKLMNEGVMLQRGNEGVVLSFWEDVHLEILAAPARAEGNGAWTKHDVSAPMEAAVDLAGIEPVVFHELRHTYASDLIKRGVSLMIVAKQLGHVDTRMVEKHYGHLAQGTIQDAIRTGATVLGIASKAPQSADDESDPPGPKAARMIQAKAKKDRGAGTKT